MTRTEIIRDSIKKTTIVGRKTTMEVYVLAEDVGKFYSALSEFLVGFRITKVYDSGARTGYKVADKFCLGWQHTFELTEDCTLKVYVFKISYESFLSELSIYTKAGELTVFITDWNRNQKTQ